MFHIPGKQQLSKYKAFLLGPTAPCKPRGRPTSGCMGPELKLSTGKVLVV